MKITKFIDDESLTKITKVTEAFASKNSLNNIHNLSFLKKNDNIKTDSNVHIKNETDEAFKKFHQSNSSTLPIPSIPLISQPEKPKYSYSFKHSNAPAATGPNKPFNNTQPKKPSSFAQFLSKTQSPPISPPPFHSKEAESIKQTDNQKALPNNLKNDNSKELEMDMEQEIESQSQSEMELESEMEIEDIEQSQNEPFNISSDEPSIDFGMETSEETDQIDNDLNNLNLVDSENLD